MSIPPIYFLKNWPAAEYEWQKNLKMQALPKSASIRFWFKKWILWKKSLLQLKFVRDITDNCKGIRLQAPKKLTKKPQKWTPTDPKTDFSTALLISSKNHLPLQPLPPPDTSMNHKLMLNNLALMNENKLFLEWKLRYQHKFFFKIDKTNK